MGKQHSPGFLKIVTDAKSRVKECTVDDVVRRQAAGDPFALVDVREDSEYAAAHAAGAVHLGKGVLERDIEKKFPDPATPLVFYCGGGFRSALAADAAQQMGYTNVISMDGGWSAWTAKGLPVER
ncbi:rhodanese-like domain-containing protein [Fimbriiglobus ruber]|uniref:Rhodanese domain protein n=1 Tax=Fimbriiglobus ruber TaxID=1908690 RepID=A0A225E2V0_9BACT|nr:rhodanese-like domain-containing protein [Fimbriiglobus ruber]OWK43005.1 Rhodanese domain protein [Fimbriiglobus ruber]